MTNGHDASQPEVRTYRGRTLEEVLPQIRAELGPDAVIVRQRDGLMGGIGGFFQQQFVEVEARAGGNRVRFDAYDDAPALPAPLDAPAADAAPAPAAEPAPPAAEAPAPAVPPAQAADALARAAAFAAQADAAAPAPGTPSRQPGRASGRRMTAAQLLAQATGAGAGDPRTPAEILREHSATFASQLAEAEERAEPVVIANQPAAQQPRADEPRPTGRYAPPVPAQPPAEPAPERADAAPAPKARRAAARRAPAARRTAAKKRRGASASAARAGAARRAATTAASARADAPAEVAAPRAPEPADAAASSAATGEPAAPQAAEPAETAAPAARADAPASGVGPQTTQALELAAALAASVAARGEEPVAPPAAAAEADGDAPPAPRAPVERARPLAAPRTRPAPRRKLLRRRRAAALPLAQVTGSPAATEITGTLAERGIAPAVARDVIVDAAAHVLPFAADGDLRAAARVALARRIPTPEPPALGGRAVAFVGAGGTGKTRCVAGLAAAYAGGSTVPVVVVSLAAPDGGAELSALLKDHGVKVEAFAGAAAASARIAQARAESLVVIDTPAVAPGDAAAIDALAAELAPLALDEVQLAVPATLGAAVAQEQLELLAPLRPTGIAMTHADATAHIGAVVELSCATRLPLAYVNSGLALPGALAPADPDQLAERLLP